MSNSTLKILPLVAASLLATFSARAQAPAPTSDVVFVDGTPFITLQDAPGQSEFAPNFFNVNGVVGAVLFFQDQNMTVLSDQIWSTNGQTLNFASDPDLQNLGTLPVLATFVETGAPQDVSGFFGFGPNFVQVLSDVDVPDTGTTGSLFGLSLMGLAFLRRKLC